MRKKLAYLLIGGFLMVSIISLQGCNIKKLSEKSSTEMKPIAGDKDTTTNVTTTGNNNIHESVSETNIETVTSTDDSPVGVWMGYQNVWAVTGSFTPMTVFMVMYDDGSFFIDMPIEGLEKFDKVESRNEDPGYWGIYTYDNKSRRGVWERSEYDQEEFEIDENGNMKIGITPYYRLSSIDGLRLEGSWTVYANPTDVLDHYGKTKPIISFTKDGMFVDQGLFVDGDFYLPEMKNDYNLDEKKVAPGEGSYSIKDYTLTLNYSDGRVRKAAFNLYFNEEDTVTPDAIFIYRRDLMRLDPPLED